MASQKLGPAKGQRARKRLTWANARTFTARHATRFQSPELVAARRRIGDMEADIRVATDRVRSLKAQLLVIPSNDNEQRAPLLQKLAATHAWRVVLHKRIGREKKTLLIKGLHGQYRER